MRERRKGKREKGQKREEGEKKRREERGEESGYIEVLDGLSGIVLCAIARPLYIPVGDATHRQTCARNLFALKNIIILTNCVEDTRECALHWALALGLYHRRSLLFLRHVCGRKRRNSFGANSLRWSIDSLATGTGGGQGRPRHSYGGRGRVEARGDFRGGGFNHYKLIFDYSLLTLSVW